MSFAPRLLALLLALLVVSGAAAFYTSRLASQPFQAYAGEEIFFTVAPGQPSSSIARALEAQGIVSSRWVFLASLWARRAEGRLQAGEYRFAGPSSTNEVIEHLVRGDVYHMGVTIPEGLTLSESADLLAKKGLGASEAFREAFAHAERIAHLDPEASDLEGYLFPNTYRFPRRPLPEQVARAMVSRFSQAFDHSRRARAAGLGLSVREVVTLSSIVEKETGRAEERPLIASVFLNRLRRGMPFQSDPTLIYQLKREGRFDGNLKRTDLEMESPYNTYRRPGLPPGPIASPGLAAIDAVLQPAESNYLYFVSRNDGSHHFSATLKEHAAAVRKYQIDYFREKRRAPASALDPS